MIEYLLAVGLIGLGFMINKDGKQKRYKKFQNTPNTQFNQDNIYKSDLSKQITQYEKDLMTQNTIKSKNPDITKIIPENYHQKIVNEDKPDVIISRLSGQTITKEHFTHNNMIPFFGSNLKQNMDDSSNATILENHSGRPQNFKAKKEVGHMFNLQKKMSNVNGMANRNEDEILRYSAGKLRNNESPIEQMRVASGLNQGFGTTGTGGFHQPEQQDIIRPKVVDELRTINNPKLTYSGRVLSGQKGTNRGSFKTMTKYHPERYYKNSPDKYFKTTGANLKPKIREKCYAKPTRKQNNRPYTGHATPAVKTKPFKTGLYRESHKNNYLNNGPRNVSANNKWSSKKENSDYGKKNFLVSPNERDVTQKRTYMSNISSSIKALIAPLIDVAKTSKRENFVGNPRPAGNLSMPIHQKMTVYDPNDVAKTTIKETTIHNSRDGNISGHYKLTAYDPNDLTKTTIKETNIHNERDGYISGHNKSTVYDPNDIARTTIKETNIHNNREGPLVGPKKLMVYDPNDVARTTIKETSIHNSYTGSIKENATGQVYHHDTLPKITIRNTLENEDSNVNVHPQGAGKLEVYDPADVTRTTMRETTLHENMGNVNRPLKEDGYLIAPDKAPNTHRQFLTDNEYTGIADGDVGKGGGRGYIIAPDKAPNTHKQFLSDYEHTNSAGSVYGKPVSYDASYNASLNINKEEISVGREPTQNNVKISSGEDTINIDIKKLEYDIINHREPGQTLVYGNTPRLDNCTMTAPKQPLSFEQNKDRIEPEILNAFRKNPYTQSLSSYGLTGP